MPLLKLKQLESGSWDRKATLDVEEKEIVILLGRNGAGKTTLLNTIAGLLPVKAGRIFFDNFDITDSDVMHRTDMGIRIAVEGRKVFQRLSVKKNLILGAYNQKDKHKIQNSLKWILEIFPDLNEKLNERAGNLSGGQQTQLNISRALMGNPRLLLLDEPTLGLDPQNINKLIKSLNIIREKQGVTTIVAEQGGILAKRFSQRCILMVGGEILFDGPWEEAGRDNEIRNVLP